MNSIPTETTPLHSQVIRINEESDESDEQPSVNWLTHCSDCTINTSCFSDGALDAESLKKVLLNPENVRKVFLCLGAGGVVSGVVLLGLKIQPHLGVGFLMGGVIVASICAPKLDGNIFPCLPTECPCPDLSFDCASAESKELIPTPKTLDRPYWRVPVETTIKGMGFATAGMLLLCVAGFNAGECIDRNCTTTDSFELPTNCPPNFSLVGNISNSSSPSFELPCAGYTALIGIAALLCFAQSVLEFTYRKTFAPSNFDYL